MAGTSERDRIFACTGETQPFVFDERVALVFDDMISRSVPLYREVTAATANAVVRLSNPGSRVYDLGCSTGAVLEAVATRTDTHAMSLIGVDSSEPMLARAKARLGDTPGITFLCADIRDVPLEPAAVIISNYTLQFLPVAERLDLLSRAARALEHGGALIVSEKVRHADPALGSLLVDLHHELKRANGYSESEIARKRDAIENVLVPLTLDENRDLLRRAGFRTSEVFLSWFNFVSLIALA